jgi:hypothetical protein
LDSPMPSGASTWATSVIPEHQFCCRERTLDMLFSAACSATRPRSPAPSHRAAPASPS